MVNIILTQHAIKIFCNFRCNQKCIGKNIEFQNLSPFTIGSIKRQQFKVQGDFVAIFWVNNTTIYMPQCSILFLGEQLDTEYTFFINSTVSFIFRKIPSYLPSLPSNGGNDLVEVVEFDSSDDQGWFTVQKDIPEESSSGFGNIIGLQVLSLNQF